MVTFFLLFLFLQKIWFPCRGKSGGGGVTPPISKIVDFAGHNEEFFAAQALKFVKSPFRNFEIDVSHLR